MPPTNNWVMSGLDEFELAQQESVRRFVRVLTENLHVSEIDVKGYWEVNAQS